METASFTRPALNADRSAVQLHQGPAYGQTQSRPFRTFDMWPGGRHLFKFVEDLGLIFICNAETRIFDKEADLIFLRQILEADLDGSALRGEFDGVGDQIDHDLTYFIGIRPDIRRRLSRNRRLTKKLALGHLRRI